MKLNEYQELASRTAKKGTHEELNYALGLAGETGEFVDLIKKEWFHGHEKQQDKKKKELGDILWYVANEARVNGWALEDVAQGNVDKLRKRYPEGFSEQASRERVE